MKTILGLSLCPMGCWALPNRLVLAKEGQVKGDLVLGQDPTGWPEPLGHTQPLFGMQCLWTCRNLMPLGPSESLWDGEWEGLT